jgi:hypothetical protein
VVEALAECRSDLELTRHIHELAPKYPDLRDPMEAGRALRRMVLAKRRELQSRERPEATGPILAGKPKLGMKAAEATLFRAVVSTEFRAEAWDAVQDSTLFLTGRAAELAAALTETFGSAPPVGAPTDWLHRLSDESMQQLLTDIEMSRDERMNSQEIRETIELLTKKRDERAVQDVKSELSGDDRLKEIDRRLRRLKGDPDSDDDSSQSKKN